MILRSITLENFGLYAGRQRLDLVPGRDVGRDQPVVLIGGKNGAGKTTLLEAVRLAYAEAGEIQRYRVERSWPADGGRNGDRLDLYKDGARVTSVPPKEWEQFLQDLVPPGVSQFFFFDGEKIAEIAHD